MSAGSPLERLGFGAFFQRQLDAAEAAHGHPGRVIEVQRKSITISDGVREHVLPLGGRWYRLPPERRPSVGDWVLFDPARGRIVRLLERRSVIARLAPGGRDEVQVIATNVDVLFVVSACNEEFSLSRIERYLALAFEAGVEPVVVLTKRDRCDEPQAFVDAARGLRPDLAVECVDARDPDTLVGVRRRCRPGTTVALVGSSGVGKSTLVNTLAGRSLKATAAARESDARGRHTTSYRALHLLPDGALVLDVPGIRELRIGEADTGVATMFEDVAALAAQCRFTNCRHEAEPGCAVRAALASGRLDARRFANYRKLREEQAAAKERGRTPRRGRRPDDGRT